MCGIVAVRSREHAERYLLPALARLEYRGYDSAGIAVVVPDDAACVLRTVERVDELARLLERRVGPELGGTGIGHTRWATHGEVSERNAHPHADCTGRVALVHNGIIENAAELRPTLRASGHEMFSDVDSEVVAHLIEDGLALGLDLVVAVEDAVHRLRGSWAIVVLDAHDGRMVAAASRSPLIVASSAHGRFVASDVAAVLPWVDEYRVLHDGDIVEIGQHADRWRRDGAEAAAPEPVPAGWRIDDISLGDHTDHMAKEIDEQPEIAAAVLDRLLPRIEDGSLWRDLELPGFRRVVVVGCGTSLNAGAVVGAAFGGLGRVPHRAEIASEMDARLLEPGTLVLAFSQSGETADVLRAVERIGGDSALLAITNNTHSSLARLAGAVVDCAAGPEIGVAASKTFVAQVITGVCLALSALDAGGRLDRDRTVVLSDELRRLPDLLAQSLAVSHLTVPPLVGGLVDASGYLFLGRGAGAVYAAEGALKLKELSYRWAEAFPAGELKHGPLALVEAGTPVVVVDDGDPRLESGVAEVAARGARVIRIGGPDATVPALGRSVAAPVRGGMDRWGPLESVIPMQVMARELALALGRDVDKPRNLAKSVTVE